MDIRNSEVEAAEISTPFGQSNLGHSTEILLSMIEQFCALPGSGKLSPILLGVEKNINHINNH